MPPTIYRKTVEDLLVASLRFWGRPEDVPTQFAMLRDVAGPHITGQPILMIHAEHPERGTLIEAAYPVSRRVMAGSIVTRTLPGGEMLCIQYTGPYGTPHAEEGMRQAWRSLFAHIRAHDIGLAEDPVREVYVAGDISRPHLRAQTFVIELQAPLLLPRWLDRLAAGLERHAGREAREHVLQGSADLLAGDVPPLERSQWAQAAMDRLDSAVPDPATRHTIMNGCAHVFPQHRIDDLRAQYEALGSVDELLAIMRGDQSHRGDSFFSLPERRGGAIYITKQPANPAGYASATDPVEKRANYCHCPLMRAAIRGQLPISDTFCNCGAGWFVQLWQGILQQPVRVDVLQSVVRGGDCCEFAIHLPPDVVAEQ